MGTIVVGVDESPSAANALRWAADEGQRRAWKVRAVLCWGFLDQHHATSTEFDPGYHAKDAQNALDAIVVSALGEHTAATVERKLVNDLAPRGLLESSAGADLLVLGARGLGTIKELMLGSVSLQCLHHSSVPVVIVKTREPPVRACFDRVVVGVDGSDESRRALEWAVEAGRVREATVVAVNVWSPPYVGGMYLLGGPADPRLYEDAAADILDNVIDDADASGLVAPVERAVVCGDARSVLVDRAGMADLVVVGSRGRGGFKELLLGSVSHHVAHYAACPVVVVPHEH